MGSSVYKPNFCQPKKLGSKPTLTFTSLLLTILLTVTLTINASGQIILVFPAQKWIPLPHWAGSREGQ
jgi:hypothetical protein